MTALWPGTFVEEANLSFQVAKLRKALGDGASGWIETVPKHGYRSAADVVANPIAVQIPAAFAGRPSATALDGLSAPGHNLSRLTTAFFVGLMLLAGVYLVLVRSATNPAAAIWSSAIAAPLTAYPGSETGPSLSPDGSQVAFSWNGPQEDNYDVDA